MTNNRPNSSLRSSTRARAAVLATTGLVAAALSLPQAAYASHGGDAVRASGTCVGGAHWTLKAKHDDAGIEGEFEVDSNVTGQTWKVRLRDNGDLFFAGKRTTKAPSGSFTVHRSTGNRAGTDEIRARAVHGDDVCRAHVTV